jgi:diguanylate cyclase (GGDEF)-like protein
MLDLDRFKLINDTFGHGAGDAALRAFTVTARRMLRPNDLFGRLGGEEFAAILPGATIETAYVVAERIRVAFSSDAAVIEGFQVGATVSAGVADSAPVSSTTASTLLREADRALYLAKQRGRNRVERIESKGHDPGGVIRVA